MTLPLTLRFLVTPGVIFRYHGDAALAEYRDGTLSVSLFFAGHDTPLTLLAPAKAGDWAELVLFPWRMELWVNGVLLDEEWPHGEPLLLSSPCIQGDAPQVGTPLPRPTPPAVLGEFTHAEGWKPEGEV